MYLIHAVQLQKNRTYLSSHLLWQPGDLLPHKKYIRDVWKRPDAFRPRFTTGLALSALQFFCLPVFTGFPLFESPCLLYTPCQTPYLLATGVRWAVPLVRPFYQNAHHTLSCRMLSRVKRSLEEEQCGGWMGVGAWVHGCRGAWVKGLALLCDHLCELSVCPELAEE